ncbi:hypothetical protein [Halalkalicoccus salilacus]|uniref:hypothetical protein n=1 Tax=Halalkalicoccus salilacus TaxID=3117459 RepID=UPI00300F2FEB
MANLTVQEFDDYDEFVQEWHATDLDVPLEEARNRNLIHEDKVRLRWQLLGQLDDDELLIQIPQWLVDQKVRFVAGTTPTEFIGRIDRETEKAILFADSASARSLTKLAHRLHQLETSIEDTDDDDRHDWMVTRLQKVRERFESRDDATALSEEWLPKSHIQLAVRRF